MPSMRETSRIESKPPVLLLQAGKAVRLSVDVRPVLFLFVLEV
jgi:hypothetical protein